MVIGSFIVALSLLLLGWTTELVGLFVTDPEKVCSLTLRLRLRLTDWLG